MHINLRCSNCEEYSPVLYSTLFRIWKQGFDQMPDEKKPEMYLTAEIKCVCGHTEKFDTPMFKYTFQTVFQEFLSLED